MRRLFIVYLTSIIICAYAISAIDVAMYDQGSGVRNSTNDLLTLGTLDVLIYDAASGGNLIYNETFTNRIVNGSWNVLLGENPAKPLALEFNKAYYKDYRINDEDASFTNSTGHSVARQKFFSPLGEIGSEDIADGFMYYDAGLHSTGLGYNTSAGDGHSQLTLVGEASGMSNTRDGLTAYGYSAGAYNTGVWTTLTGLSSGYNNSGHGLVASGYRSGRDNIGMYSTFYGYEAGFSNQGDNTVGIGYHALSLNKGNITFALGYQAGKENEGNRALALGYQALLGNTGDDIIALGYQAGKDNTMDSQFILKQANVNSVPLIQGNFSSGFVGIGIAAPKTRLHVYRASGGGAAISAAQDLIAIENNNSAYLNFVVPTDQFAGMIFSDNVRSRGWILYNLADNMIQLGTTMTNRVYVTSDGNMGINTDTPDSKLEIADGAPGSNINALHLRNTATDGTFAGSNIIFSGLGYNNTASITGTGGDEGAGYLTFSTRTFGGTTPQTRMVIDSDGEIGIGILSPARKLHINATMRLEPISAAPDDAGEGDIYFNSILHKPCYYNGTDWLLFDGDICG